MILQIAIIDGAKPPKALVEAAKKEKFDWGEAVGNYKIFPCHLAQLDILRSKAKFTFAFAGSGGGKTILVPLWMLKCFQRNPRARALLVSPTERIYQDSELKRHIIETFSDTAFAGEWRQKYKTYVLKTGGEIVVKTAEDDANRIRGGQYDFAALDECYVMSPEVWEEARRRVSNANGPLLGVTTPDSNNWIYNVKQAYDGGDTDYYVRTWSKLDNPTVSTLDVKREEKLLNPARYARMIEGKFATLEGLCYPCFSDEKSPEYPVVKADPYKRLISPPVRFFSGNDWGYSPDPAAHILFAECEDGIIYAVDEIYGTEITPDEYARRVRALIDKWALKQDSKYASLAQGAYTTCWTDTSRPEHMGTFRALGISIRKKKIDDILGSIAVVDSWFRAGRLKVYPNCENLIREAKGYAWQKNRKGETKDMPNEKNNHACDALRYGVSSQMYGKTPEPLEIVISAELSAQLHSQKIERYGLNEQDLKDTVERQAKQKYSEWFNRMINLEAGQ